MTDADARTRDHERVKLCIFLQGRKTVTIGKFPFEAREGAIMAHFIRRILGEKCTDPNRDE
jgi:hypothetical protein